MKKVIISIILMLPLVVNAETFYTKYYIKAKDSIIYYDENENLKREEKKVYNNYNYIRINEDYYPLYHNPITSPILDTKDEIWSNWAARSMLSNSEGPFTKFWVKKLSNVKYFMFRSFQAPKATFDSLKVYCHGQEVPYSFYKSDFQMGSQITTSTEFIIELDKSYNIYDLEIETNFTDPSLSRIAYMIKAFSEYMPDPTKFEFFSNEVVRGKAKEKYIVTFEKKEDFQNFIRSEAEWVHEKDYETTYEVNYYKYPIKKYKYYNLIKNYSNHYSDAPLDGYYLDYNDFKYLYSYYERFVIEIKDEINSVDDFNHIISKSTYPIENINIIETPINADEYNINVKFLDEDINKKVKVNIKPVQDNSKVITTKSHIINVESVTSKIKPIYYKKNATTTTTKVDVKKVGKQKNIRVYRKNFRFKNVYFIIIVLLIFTIFLLIIRKKKN